ncbi:MAG: hypothetical protein HY928_12335, partial [Elusimicrobia bacterium]|nr:hypothetical protein [Elusimicrobiota bacterium]
MVEAGLRRRRSVTLVLAFLFSASGARAAENPLGLVSPESRALYAELSALFALLEPRPAPKDQLEAALTRFEALAARIPAELSAPLEKERLTRGTDIVRGLFEKRLPSTACRLGPLYAGAFSTKGKDAARNLECLALEAAVREPAPDASALLKRLEDLRALMARHIIDPGEARTLAARLDLVAASLRHAAAPARTEGGPRLTASETGLELRDALAAPGGLERYYDNSAAKAASKDPVLDLPPMSAAEAPAAVSAPAAVRPLSAPVPSPKAPAPSPAPEASLFELVAEPFASLTEGGRRAYFVKKRAAWRQKLASPQSDRSLYQIFVQEALAGDAVADGTRFEPWEIGSQAEGASAAVRASLEHGGETYRGLTLEYANGSTRFEGSAARSSLVVVRLSGQDREVRTEIRYGVEEQKARTETSVIDTKTGQVIERELLDIAAALLTRTLYEGGEPVRRETLDSNSGVRLIEDLKTGLKARRGADGKTEVTSLDPKKTGWVTQQGTSDHAGFHVDRLVLENGNTAVAVSPSVFKVLDAEGKQLGFELDMAVLADGAKGAERAEASRRLAAEVVAALGYADKDREYSLPLQTFLSETWTKEGRFSDVKLFFNAQGELLLKYQLLSGERRYEQARFGAATPFQGQDRAHKALLVMRPQHIPAGSAAAPTVSGIKWNEYLDTGGYNHWHSMFGTEVPSWYQLWKDPKMVEWVYLQRWRRGGGLELGSWEMQGSQLWTVDKRSLVDQPSTSSGITKSAGDALSSLGRMTQAMPSELIYRLGGGDGFRRRSAQAYGKSPAMTYFLDADDFWKRVPASQRPVIEARAQAYRARALGYFDHVRGKTDERTYWHLLAYPYNHDELFDALRENFTLTHARRVIREVERTLAFAEASLPAGSKDDAVTSVAGSDPYRTGSLNLGDRALDSIDGIRRAAPPAALQAAQNTGRLLSGGLYGDWVADAASGMNPADGGPSGGSGGAGGGAGAGDIGALGKTAREAPSPEQRGEALTQLQNLKNELLKKLRPPEFEPQVPSSGAIQPAPDAAPARSFSPAMPAGALTPEPSPAPAALGPTAPAKPAGPTKAEPAPRGAFTPMKPAKPVKAAPAADRSPSPDIPAPAGAKPAGGAPGEPFMPNLPNLNWEPPQPPKGPPSSSSFNPRWLLPALLLARKKEETPRIIPAPTWPALAAQAFQQAAQSFPNVSAVAPVMRAINEFAGTPAPQPANVAVARQAPAPAVTQPSFSPVTTPSVQPAPVLVNRASPEPAVNPVAQPQPVRRTAPSVAPAPTVVVAQPVPASNVNAAPQLEPTNVTVTRQAPAPAVTQPQHSPANVTPTQPAPTLVRQASP